MFFLLCLSLGRAEVEIQEEPSPPETRAERLEDLAQSLEKQRFTSEAIDAYGRLFSLTSKVEYLQKQATLCVSIKDYPQAVRILEEGLWHIPPAQRQPVEKQLKEIKEASPMPPPQTVNTSFEIDDFTPNLYQDRDKWKKQSLVVLGSLGVLSGVLLGIEASTIRGNLRVDGCFSKRSQLVCASETQLSLDKQRQFALYADIGWLIAASSFGLKYYWNKHDVMYRPSLVGGGSL